MLCIKVSNKHKVPLTSTQKLRLPKCPQSQWPYPQKYILAVLQTALRLYPGLSQLYPVLKIRAGTFNSANVQCSFDCVKLQTFFDKISKISKSAKSAAALCIHFAKKSLHPCSTGVTKFNKQTAQVCLCKSIW